MTEPKGVKSRYKTTHWAEYNVALKSRGALTIWLDKTCRGTRAPVANEAGSKDSAMRPYSSV